MLEMVVAVVYECMSTVTSIYPSSQLVELGARTLGRFLRSDNNNLKYLGITALIAVVKVTTLLMLFIMRNPQ